MYVPERVIQSCSFAFGTFIITITAGRLPVLCLFTTEPPTPLQVLDMRFVALRGSKQSVSLQPKSRRSSHCIRAKRPMIVSFSPKKYAAIAQLKHKSGQAPMFCVVYC